MTIYLNSPLGRAARSVTVAGFVLVLVGLAANRASARPLPDPQVTPQPQATPATVTNFPATPSTPGNTTTGVVELGGGNISNGSFKAGEYNGLQDKGFFGIGNVDVRGGGAYDSASALRWRVAGTALFLDTRSIAGEIGVQGKFRIMAGFDSILRNRSDSYQTPYNGAGTDTLTLPSSWLVPVVASSSGTNNHTTTTSARGLVPSIGGANYIDTQTNSPTVGKIIAPNASQLAAVNGAAAADVPLFHNVDLFTKRLRYDQGLNLELSKAWAVDLNFREEHKDGLKPMGTVSRNTGGDISTIIPDLIDTDTDQITTNVSYRGERGYMQAGYYGSLFTNHVASMSWQNWATTTGTMNRMSSAPSNSMHQLNAEARYNFSPKTHLFGNLSYGHNTQNDAFLIDPTTTVPVVPVSSLNGLVVWKAAGATLTSKRGKFDLVANYTFNDRDNQTGVHIFQYADAGETATASTLFPASATNALGAVLAQNANANRPYSKRSNLASASADYSVAHGQWLRAGYDFERIDRWCTGTWIDCADAGVTNENRFLGEWRANLGERVNARVDYTLGLRRSPNYNENAFLALVPYAGVSPSSVTDGQTALSFMLANGWTGWGPALGFAPTTGDMNVFFPSNNALANNAYANNNRISEVLGVRRYYVADRDRNRVRSLLDWQTTDTFSIEGGVDYTNDDYPASTYGLQSTNGWSANLDGTYAMGENATATVYYTYQHQRGITFGNGYTANSNTTNVNGFTALSGNYCDSFTTLQQRNNNNKLDPCVNWSSNMLDTSNTFGFQLAKTSGKLTVSGDGFYSRSHSTNDFTGGSWANNPLALPGAPAGTIAAFFIPATPLPVVTTENFELRLHGGYLVAAHQTLRLVYAYLWMKSADWVYDGMQIGAGTIAGVLPSNETAFNYGVHIFGVSYVIGF